MKHLLLIILSLLAGLSILFYVHVDRTGEVKEANQNDFISIIQKNSKEPTILVIGRKSCPHCQRYLPYLKKQVKKNKDIVWYLDVEKIPEKNKNTIIDGVYKLNVTEVPTILVIKNGKVIDKATGQNIKESTNKILEKY
ncbi:thioredoxin family protein [Enterococcus mundtii]|uniref:thioredoxin family protein n=1 Tax=Enterococcus mundtii TaxID=53346 RepID=UPI0011594016|nr:thioredoxin family protein [Enterococcus mundtii]